MIDINGREIRTGDIVKISDAYFKNDNGIYFVTNSPGDTGWSGRDYCLKKLCKNGKMSNTKHNIGFWPISIFVSNREKRIEGNRWNKENAKIEIIEMKCNENVIEYFKNLADELEPTIKRAKCDFGSDSIIVENYKGLKKHYEMVAARIARK